MTKKQDFRAASADGGAHVAQAAVQDALAAVSTAYEAAPEACVSETPSPSLDCRRVAKARPCPGLAARGRELSESVVRGPVSRLRLYAVLVGMTMMAMFGPGAGFAQTTVSFEQEEGWTGDGSLSGYGSHTYAEAGLSVHLAKGLRNPSTIQDGVDGALGAYSVRLRDEAGSQAEFRLPEGGLLSFEMQVRRWDGSPSPSYNVELSADGGATWAALAPIGATLLVDSGWKRYESGEIRSTAGDIRVRVARVGGERIMIDDFSWIGYSANPAAKLDVTAVNGGRDPSDSTPFDVVVQLQDSGGGPVLAETDVAVQLSSSAGVLSGTTSATIQSGSESVTLTGLTLSGMYSGVALQVVDVAAGLASGQSDPFDVLPRADQLVWEQVPSTGLANRTLQPVMLAARRSGDSSLDLNFTGHVTLSTASGPGSIAGTLIRSAVDGVATFDDLIAPLAGSYTLSATDGTIHSPESAPVTVAPLPNVVINEFLADPDLTLGDANGDGTVSTSQDEFVEIVNAGSDSLTLSGWTLEDEAGAKHQFADPTVIAPGQAMVVFGGGTPADIFGDALVTTASSGSLGLNNSGDSITLRDSLGQLVETITFGSSAGGNQALTRSPDLTGEFAVHSTVDSDNGTLFSPGTRLNGSGFRHILNLTGAPGWRILSSPLQGAAYSELLGPFWTQGSAVGADYSGGTPNVMTYESGGFQPVDDLNQAIPAGSGFLFYAFADDDYSGSQTPGFPKAIVLQGQEREGEIAMNVSPTAGEWTLLGNPYNAPIDHTLLTKGSGLEASVYALDAATGTYLSHNGVGGSLPEGRIAAFHGFWVRTFDAGGDHSLTFSRSAIRQGAVHLHKTPAHPVISLRAVAAYSDDTPGRRVERSGSLHLTFTPDGKLGMDPMDALQLEPLSQGAGHVVFAADHDGTLLDIVNLPNSQFERIRLPIRLAAFTAGADGWVPATGAGSMMVEEFDKVPSSWSIEWVDTVAGIRIPLEPAVEVEFELVPQLAKSLSGERPTGPVLQQFESARASMDTRYWLEIRSAVDQSVSTTDAPDWTRPTQLVLHPNSPNPFNPSTTISFDLPIASRVDLLVYDMMGRLVHTEFSGREFRAGSHRVVLDFGKSAASMNSGTYLCQIRTGSQFKSQLITLVK